MEHANQTLSPIFDKEKEQTRLKEAQLIGEIGTQAMDIARTQGKIIATKAANDKMATANDADRQTAKAQWKKANPGETPTDKQVNEQVYSNFYNQAFSGCRRCHFCHGTAIRPSENQCDVGSNVG